MAYSFRNAGSAGTSFNAACTPGAPASIIANDLLIVVAMELLGSDTRPVVSGWTDQTLGANWTTGAAIYTKIAIGGDSMPAIPSWGNQFQVAVCLVYSGGPTTLTGLIDTTNSSDRLYNSTNTLLFHSTNAAPTNNNCLLLGISFKNTLGNASPVLTETGGFVGFTRRVTQWPNAARPTIVVDEQIQTTATNIVTPGFNINFTESSTQAGQSTILIFNPAVIAGTPFIQQDQPARVEAKLRPSSLHEFWQVPDEIRSVAPATYPPSVFDMPAFILRARSNVLLGIEQSIPSPLVGKDRVLTPVDWQYGWDPPQLPVALRSDSSPLTVNELLQLTTYPPYTEYNWPVPAGARQWNRGYEFSVNLNLVGKDNIPLGALHNLQWDPPAGPRRPISNQGFELSGLALANTVQPIPTIGTRYNDWPVPLRARQPVQDFIQSMPETIASLLTTFPPFVTVQDLPIRRVTQPVLTSDGSRIALLQGRDVIPFGTRYDQQNVRIIYKADIYTIAEVSQFLIPTTPPVPPGGLGVRHVGRVILDPANVGEAVNVPFDFISGMSAGEVLTSAVTVCTLYSGTDPTPQAVISAAATVSGTIALQQCTPTIVGNIYDLKCTVTTSLGQILSLNAYFAIIPGVP